MWKTLQRRLSYLSPRISTLVQEKWNRRFNQENPCSTMFGVGCFGSVDSFPIFIRRPKDNDLQAACYSGKYKRHCLKVQVVVDFHGCPIFVSGPHLGAKSDIALWRNFGPAMGSGDFVLGDKGYQGDESIHSPYKKPKGRKLSQAKKDYNRVLSWFRVTVEHCFAQMKKFSILQSRVRFHLQSPDSIDFLTHTVNLISSLITLQAWRTPLRSYYAIPNNFRTPLGDLVDFYEYKSSHPMLPNRPSSSLVLGDPKNDIVLGQDGKSSGRGPEPSSDGIHTGHLASNFSKGEKVLVWWWGLWWHAVVQYVSTRNNTVCVRWGWDHSVSSGYPAKLVSKI
jgi:hypothetical protein